MLPTSLENVKKVLIQLKGLETVKKIVIEQNGATGRSRKSYKNNKQKGLANVEVLIKQKGATKKV